MRGRGSLSASAVVLICFLLARPAFAGCSPPAATVDCTGDLNGGVSFNSPPVNTVNAHDLTNNIGATNTPGVGLISPHSQADTGHIGVGPISGGDGDDGSSGGNNTINFTGPSQGFQLNAGSAIGLDDESHGQDGGTGGKNFTTAIIVPPFFAFGGSGDGGKGGKGGDTSVVTTGTGLITTTGDSQHGILSLSSGGKGGDGGDQVGLGGIFGSAGDGGDGGSPGTAYVSNTLNISTNGVGAAGIWAQSVGGSGGNGGTAGGNIIDSGGKGKAASDGELVHVIQTGIITTQGDKAVGIFAQSIGGFAGSGGGAFGLGSFAGDGSSAGAGGMVMVEDNGGSIETHGVGASAIYAQSVGGGGGAGGVGGGLVGFGGDGGPGGAGQQVTVSNSAALMVHGNQSSGIFAQSVGGGGGAAGFAAGLVSIGGSGKSGGNGGAVEVHNFGTIDTFGTGNVSSPSSGTFAAGIFAQSVGGGGGDGGAAGGLVAIGGSGSKAGDGGTVTVTNTNSIISHCVGNCTGTDAIFAQSVGGGGGNGGSTGGLAALGGNGGAGGKGDTVTVANSGNLTTVGTNSAGLFAQSVGGGGGNGGFALGVGAFASFAFGGKGSAGGDGGIVCVNTDGGCTTPVIPGASIINTKGDRSAGIFAQSIGGGGGNGGFAISASGGLFGDVALAFGGGGGAGGKGQNVFVGSGGTITTGGSSAAGIDAESVGGGGGNGGFAIGVSGSTGGNLTLTFAGKGAMGNTGGAVSVMSATNITTTGDNSDGIFAHSVGGGGGNGGFTVTGAGGAFGAVALGFGGKGGDGGDGGNVNVNSNGTIMTSGMQSAGVVAESIGGGGGNGGFAISASGASYGALSVGFGGDAGSGAKGLDARIDSTGAVMTTGTMSDGILAQSLGGGGGNGGFSVAAAVTISTGASGGVAIGGQGGVGGTSNVAHVNSNGNITTTGAESTGILAQSVGGSGGNGGFAGAFALADGVAFTQSIGGKGGTGNKAGAVDVTSTGNVTTTNDSADGIIAQSIGGGGGNGGFSLTVKATLDGSDIGGGKGMGGIAGGGGMGDRVSVVSNGTVHTSGALSDGIFAQSVGGGGGNGGFAVGASLSYSGSTSINAIGGAGGTGNTASTVSVLADATAGSSIPGYSVVTSGDGSVGILAQSIGGGGGNGGFSVAASISAGAAAEGTAVGGTGGGAGSSLNFMNLPPTDPGYMPSVLVVNSGSIQTAGRNASGILAQSIGGGGGNGGFAVGGAVTVSSSDAKIQTIGGAGGAGGDGADVIVRSNNAAADSSKVIVTQRDLSYGILAQSVGGGGGNGGFAISGSLSTGGGATSNAVGGDGMGGGIGGNVTVVAGGMIETGRIFDPMTGAPTGFGGDGSVGILAQSIGGGGGNGGFVGGLSLGIDGAAVTITTGGHGGVGSNGGTVNVTTVADSSILTFGSYASGIIAQSIGGGGGNGGFSIGASFSSNAKSSTNSTGGQGGGGGTGGDVTVDNSANIQTTGLLSHGILAQSVGGGGGNGGFAIAGSVSLGDDATSNTTGGHGGIGEDANTVMVTNRGTISVHNVGTIGIIAQSIGGGGGNGGFAGALSFSSAGKAITNSIGGNGAGAGNGGVVTVENFNTVTASGDQGIGIFAQSVGGGGGNGAFALSGAVSTSAQSENQTTGGQAGAGGGAMKVTVTNHAGGVIMTSGAMAYGILAQSIGGGGGNGGFSIGAGFSSSADTSDNATGGKGGTGGKGADVTVMNDANIQTSGLAAHGIFAQSVGGGGGNGGFAIAGSLSLGGNATSNTIGGNGGTGQDSGTVQVTNHGVIFVQQMGSIGILAQSIGGGGGNGGFAGGLAFSSSGDAVSNNIGASGAGAGNGGIVTVENFNSITSSGDQGIGILAQSVGGGGGNGAFALTAATSTSAKSETQTVGGKGGTAGDGMSVTVMNHAGGAITTNGAMAYGILAQSVGGGGGNGGFSLAGNVSLGGDATSNVSGGAGGGGGKAGAVTVDNFDTIQAMGVSSIGILAQSVAGGGGTGGFAGGLTFASGGGVSNMVGSGAGGAGESPDTVTVTNHAGAFIHTFKDNSTGIFAQAVGGSGGNGAFSISTAGSTGGDGLNQSVGGSGGNGGSVTKLVKVVNEGNIQTDGALSYGIYAQSVGGGGGNGGVSVAGTLSSAKGITSSVGGSGGMGGSGGPVEVDNPGTIVINGAGSVGILAQSIGGGGGTGGFSGAVDVSGGGVQNNVGGKGGMGGSGGDVTVTSTGSITTVGANSVAVIAQSVGGGGGVGGFAISAASSGMVASADVNVGDVAATLPVPGDAGAKGTVTVTISGGTLHTTGSLATAALVQSIAGGGGIGGLSVGDPMVLGPGGSTLQVGGGGLGGNALMPLTPQNADTIMADMDGSMGFAAQSIGGGGGVGQVAGNYTLSGAVLTATVGGTGANGGSGNQSMPTNTGDVTTKGDNGIALLAQSIGGGGGVANFSFNALDGSANAVVLRAGGTQAVAGNGEAASFSTSGMTSTSGDLSPGVVVQSIGGGGGVSGLVARQGIAVGANGVTIDLGSRGGSGGDGGTADTTVVSGSIFTSGRLSPAVIAQSIGGGGGFAGFVNAGSAVSETETKIGSQGVVGNGGAVDVVSNKTINTSGAGADGIVAHSVGGGGGLFLAFAPDGSLITQALDKAGGGLGTAAPVTVKTTANIITTGQGATGIIAASVASNGLGGNINVTNPGVMIVGGSGSAFGSSSGNAIALVGGLNNTITNAGILTTVDDLAGFTVTGTKGNDGIINSNLIIGSIDLGGGMNSFDNKPTGVFNSGSIVNLGAGNALTNEGLISPGRYLKVFTTNETGNFVQTASGIYGLDLQFRPQAADRINITGPANLAGNVQINLLDAGRAVPGQHVVTILHADGGITRNGIGLIYCPTAVAQYMLVTPRPPSPPVDLNLQYNINFSPSGLTTNEHSVGNAINSIQIAGVAKFEPIAKALFYTPTLQRLGAVYDSLSGEGTSGTEQTAFSANSLFMNSIITQTEIWRDGTEDAGNSIVVGARSATPFSPAVPRTWRSWTSAYGGVAQVDSALPLGSARLDYTGAGATGGVDLQVAPNAILGVAGGGGSSAFSVPNRLTTGRVESGHVAIYGSAAWGSLYTSGIVGYDFFRNSTKRSASIPGDCACPMVSVRGFGEDLYGRFGSSSYSGKLETGYKRTYGAYSLTPFASVQVSALNASPFTETTPLAPTRIGLNYLSRGIVSVPTFLGLKLAGRFALMDNVQLVPFGQVAWVHEFQPQRTLQAEFVAAPGFPFVIGGAEVPDNSAQVMAGLRLDIHRNVSLYGTFDSELSPAYRSYAGRGGVSLAW